MQLGLVQQHATEQDRESGTFLALAWGFSRSYPASADINTCELLYHFLDFFA